MKVKKFSAVLVAFLVAVTSMVLPLSDTFNSVIKTTGSAKAVTKNSAVKMPSDAILFDSSEEKWTYWAKHIFYTCYQGVKELYKDLLDAVKDKIIL